MAKSLGQIQSRKQERRIVKSLKEIGLQARQQMASGAMWFAKSDVISDMFQIEAKTKAKPSKSITLKSEWFDKIHQEALMVNKIPALVFSFGDNVDYFVLRDRDFLEIVEELLALRELETKV